MGNRRWKKRGQGSQRKDAEFPTLVQIVNRQSPSYAPEWEKRFRSQMKWRGFCDEKRVVHLFPKVVEWDDSAGKEAFDNAKARFWAEINNLPSEIPLPDPNMYIQEVDYDAYIDPSLIHDLYSCSELDPSEITAEGIVDYSSVPIIPTGWGDEDNQNSRISAAAEPITIIPTGWGDEDNQNSRISAAAEPITIIPTGWGDEKNSEPIDAWDSQARPLNGASVLNNENNVEIAFGTAEDHGRGWKQDGKGYSKERWTNYNKGQYFWRQKPSLDRGLSCAPENH